MKNKLFVLCLVAILTITLVGSSSAAQTPSTNDLAKSVESLPMFQVTKFNAHYRAPNVDQIEMLLEREGISLAGASRRTLAVQRFQEQWAERNPTTPNPEKLRKLLERERGGGPALMSAEAEVPQIMSLAVPVEFPNADTFMWCGDEVTTQGPLHNEIPAPGPRDNNTIWYEDATPELYSELYFGVGPNAGVVVNHPNLGTVDLRGSTMANFYLEQSAGAFVPKGLIYPAWLQAAHSEGWYGADGEVWEEGVCSAGGSRPCIHKSCLSRHACDRHDKRSYIVGQH